MKKTGMRFTLVLGMMLLACLALCFGAAAEEAAKQDVLILFTSDVHCGVDQNFGYAGLQAARDKAVADGIPVLLVDDGDSIQGEAIGIMTRGQDSIEMMNALKYDVAIPGNHEFDYGMDRFLELAEMAEFPYISCNFNKEGKLIFDPWIIREAGGVKIGFVGATTPESLTSSSPTNFQNEEGEFIYSFMQGNDGADFYAAVQKAVDEVREAGAEYVVLIAHLGNEAACKPYTYADVIEHTSGIDVVLDGHSHDTDKVVMKNKEGKNVIRQACGTKMACIGWLRISPETESCETGLYIWQNDISAPDLLGIDNEMNRMVKERVDVLAATLADEVGTTAVTLTHCDPEAVDANGVPIRIARRAETNLCDLVTDAYRTASGADVGLVNGGTIRVSIPRGTITLNSVFNVFPFGNKILTVEMTGQQLLDALEFGASKVPEENGGFLHVSGVTYEIHTYMESNVQRDDNGMFTGVNGEYRVKNVLVGGEPLDPEKIYRVASMDFILLKDGDGNTAFRGAKVVGELPDLDYLVVANYIKDTLKGVVGEEYSNPYGQGRIVAVEEAPAQ